jgi:hypothetical protein
VFRSRAIALASTGMSRAGVASGLGKARTVLCEWLSRGLAEPHIEPYGSFSRDYLMAERGLEAAASQAEAMRVQLMLEQLEDYLRWRDRGPPPPKPVAPQKPSKKATPEQRAEHAAAQALYASELAAYEAALLAWQTPPKHPDVSDFEWLGRLKERRYPADHGVSKHRVPETELTGAEWLEQHPLEHAQLVTLLTDPPEAVDAAQRETLDAVVMRQLDAGWRPSEASAQALRAVLEKR